MAIIEGQINSLPNERNDNLARMGKLALYGYVACGVGVAALITGLLPRDKMDKVRSFLHEHFSREGASVNQATARTQLIIFGAFFLFLGLVLSGLIQL